MHIIGLMMVLFLVVGAFVVAQAFFYNTTGRVFWRAMVPTQVRFMILQNDKVEMDSFMVLEEWAALMFMCSSLLLPTIALNSMGFVNFF